MRLRDILPHTPIKNIMVRVNAPEYIGGDMIFGYCSWDGSKLTSLDGDSYSLDAEVTKHELDGSGLICWMKVDWI